MHICPLEIMAALASITGLRYAWAWTKNTLLRRSFWWG